MSLDIVCRTARHKIPLNMHRHRCPASYHRGTLHMASHTEDRKTHWCIHLCTCRWCENTRFLGKTDYTHFRSEFPSTLPDTLQNSFLLSRCTNSRSDHYTCSTCLLPCNSCCHIYRTFTTLATSRARGEVWVKTTDTSGTCQVAGRTTVTIWNVTLT